MPQDQADLPLELLTMHDAIQHAMFEQELGALKAVRQFLPNGLFDDTRAGETDERLGLGQDDVPEHRKARGDAARRRMEEDGDVRDTRLAQPAERGRGL